MADKTNKGWIKLDRAIRDHWLWSSERHSKQSAWIDLLLMVNHEDNKITIGNQVITIHQGQTWTSYKKLKERWKWSNDRLRAFIGMLVSDGMIAVNPTKTGTLITVLNYSIYQGLRTSDTEPSVHQSVHQSENKPVNGSVSRSVTNKNDRRMRKNEEEGDRPQDGEFEP